MNTNVFGVCNEAMPVVNEKWKVGGNRGYVMKRWVSGAVVGVRVHVEHGDSRETIAARLRHARRVLTAEQHRTVRDRVLH